MNSVTGQQTARLAKHSHTCRYTRTNASYTEKTPLYSLPNNVTSLRCFISLLTMNFPKLLPGARAVIPGSSPRFMTRKFVESKYPVIASAINFLPCNCAPFLRRYSTAKCFFDHLFDRKKLALHSFFFRNEKLRPFSY